MLEGSMTREWTRPARAALAPTIVTRRWSPRSHRAQSRARNLGLGRGAGTRVVSCGRHPFQCVVWCSHLFQHVTCHHALQILANMLSVFMKLVMSNV